METGLQKNESMYNTIYFILLFGLTFSSLQAQNTSLKNKKHLNTRIEIGIDRGIQLSKNFPILKSGEQINLSVSKLYGHHFEVGIGVQYQNLKNEVFTPIYLSLIGKRKQKKGIYIDIGCGHPIKNNNTYLLNKKGWSGINIDLDIDNIELFKIYRPNDLNICAAISDEMKETDLFFYHSRSALNTIDKKKEELLSALVLMFCLLLICSTGVYFAENEAQPDKFSSIISSMWWAVATLTTVGYGDIFPITTMGKLFGSISAIFGVGLFAIPAGILASGFSSDSVVKILDCPHCGKRI